LLNLATPSKSPSTQGILIDFNYATFITELVDLQNNGKMVRSTNIYSNKTNNLMLRALFPS
jgi:hypothetical protein